MSFKKVLAVALTATMVASMAFVASADDSATAKLIINDDSWVAATSTEVAVTGDGTYTLSASFAEAKGLAQFNSLDIVDGDTVFGHTYIVTIDSIKIDGVEAKEGNSYTCTADGKGTTTRVNIYNEWNNPDQLNVVDEKAGYADQRGNSADATAKLISDEYIQYDGHDASKTVTSVEVTFTVSGLSKETGAVAPITAVSVIALASSVVLVAKKRA